MAERSPDRASLGQGQGALPRVAFLSHTAEWVGPTNSLTLLLRRVRHRFDVEVFVPGVGPFTEGLDELGISWLEFPALDKWDVLRLRRALVDHSIDLLYANNTHSSSRIGMVAARLAGIPFITHVRGMAWDKGWGRMGYLRLAERVIAVSDACGESVRRFAGSGRLVTVHNGIPLEADAEIQVGDREEIRREFGYGPNDLVVASVSHVMPRKGQEHSVAALKILAVDVPEAKLLLIGKLDRDPAYVSKLRGEIESAGLGDRVLIPGFRSDVGQILSAADVFVHTALADPHPRSVIEAMARGLPVVAFAADGVPETVVEGTTGFLSQPGDVPGLAEGLSKLLTDEGLRVKMGKAGRQRVEAHFTDDATASKIAEQITQVLNSRKGLS